MIDVEMNTGFNGRWLRAHLAVGSTRIDLGDGDSMTEEQTECIVNELQTVVDKLREFADRKKKQEQQSKPDTHAADIETVRGAFDAWWTEMVGTGQWTTLERLAAKAAWNAILDRLEGK